MKTPPTLVEGTAETPPHRSLRWLKATFLVLAIFIFLLVVTYRIWFPRVVVGYGLFALDDKISSTQVSEKELDATPATGPRYELDGVAFQVPWTDLSLRRGTTTLALNFGTSTNMRTVALFPGNEFKTLVSTSDGTKFFDGKLSTNYDVYRAAVEAQPSDVNLLAPPQEFLPKWTLLVLKSIITPPSAQRFENMYGIRGFHHVSSATSTITEFFTPSDRHYSLIISNATPEETDAILQSLQEVTAR